MVSLVRPSDTNVGWGRGSPLLILIYYWGRRLIAYPDYCLWEGVSKKLALGTREFHACNMLMIPLCYFLQIKALARGWRYLYTTLNFYLWSSLTSIRPPFIPSGHQVWSYLISLTLCAIEWEVFDSLISGSHWNRPSFLKLTSNASSIE